MGKKSKKKKLKKKLRKMIRAQMAQSEQSKAEGAKATTPESNESATVSQTTTASPKTPPLKTERPPTKKASFTQRLNPYFSYDLKKVLITIGVSLSLSVAFYLISLYTNWLTIISENLAQIINL